jgi:hypothetical protein
LLFDIQLMKQLMPILLMYTLLMWPEGRSSRESLQSMPFRPYSACFSIRHFRGVEDWMLHAMHITQICWLSLAFGLHLRMHQMLSLDRSTELVSRSVPVHCALCSILGSIWYSKQNCDPGCEMKTSHLGEYKRMGNKNSRVCYRCSCRRRELQASRRQKM